MNISTPLHRPLSSGAIGAEGPTARVTFLALAWCAFLLLACAMATRFDEKRMVRSAGSPEASPRAAGTQAPGHSMDIAAGRPLQ